MDRIIFETQFEEMKRTIKNIKKYREYMFKQFETFSEKVLTSPVTYRFYQKQTKVTSWEEAKQNILDFREEVKHEKI